MSAAHSNTERDTTTEPTTPDQRRAEALRRAARGKREAATARAEQAIRELATTDQEINFRSVARAGGVSLDFLYANTDLRQRIETLRKQQDIRQPDPPPTTPAPETASAIATTLTAKLHQERAAHRTAVTELEHRLAAAHGELLRLRRLLDQHGIQT